MTVKSQCHPGTTWRLATMVAAIYARARLSLQRRRALAELDALSDHHLQDIGIDRPRIPELVKREFAWNGLLDSGWPRSRRPRQR